jgi:excinuclease ABC subunit B
MIRDRDEILKKLIAIQYDRNDMDFKRGTFRVRGDVVEIFPAYSGDLAVRIEFFGDEVERILEIDTLTGEIRGSWSISRVSPASHMSLAPPMRGKQSLISKRSWRNGAITSRVRTSFCGAENF